MELRDFAEQILFATSLEEKLLCPGRITDAHPGPPIISPDFPGRPSHLRFKTAGSSAFPGMHHLDRNEDRGRLLHFFANHELLATELMALVLLRFPDAPPEFRRGVLRTLREEQEHTSLYLERMASCGIHFGDLPVSGYFWRAVSAMQSPLDYVAGLSLTFEQANLDFARQFSLGFAAVGDLESARLLKRIYHDEISHVAYGLKWFRRWKDSRLSDWEAFSGLLRFPLSPRRARGTDFNAEGRLAAGLDPEFIRELSICSQSKGRTPGVYFFNPFAEGHIVQGRSFTPVAHQAALARDLAGLPQFLARQDDIVLVPERPAATFLATLREHGFVLPEFVEAGPGAAGNSAIIERLSKRKLGRLRPWAWSPDSVERFRPLFNRLTGEKRSPDGSFNERIARLYSKGWSAALLRQLLAGLASNSRETGFAHKLPHPGTWLCGTDDVGVTVDSPEAAFAAVARLRSLGHLRLVAKEAIGLAGHNAIRLWESQISNAQRRWIVGALQERGQLVIEPWLDRELDFSVQFEMTPGGLKLFGFTGLINDSRGQYRGNWAEPQHRRHTPSGVAHRLRRLLNAPGLLVGLYQAISGLIEKELRVAGYIGPVGIDAFVYRSASGESRLKPIVEINPRYTMGRLTLELMKQTCPGSHGLFRLVTLKEVRAAGRTGLVDYARHFENEKPLQFEGRPNPKIRAGGVCLNDPTTATVCLATFEVGRESLIADSMR